MNVADITQGLVDVLTARLVPMLIGQPGIGKSDIIRNIAAMGKLKIIDMRLSQCDPTDLLGFPTHDGERMGYAPPKDIPLQDMDEIPDGYKGWLLFMDEFPSAPLAVQAAAYKVVLDRQIGSHDIHKDCYIVCAGNGEADGGIVKRLSTPMQSRLIHMELEVDVKSWVSWATSAQLDHRVISYVEGHPDHLHAFDPNHQDKTFACPRTWEFTSKLIKDKTPNPILQQLLIGTLSAGVGHEFYSHLNYCADLPSIDDIIQRPDDIAIPDEPALLYATSHMVAAYLDQTNASRLMRYIDRLPLDFGVTAARSALKRKKELMQVEEMRVWAHKIANEVF
jgi:hypothetical protein